MRFHGDMLSPILQDLMLPTRRIFGPLDYQIKICMKPGTSKLAENGSARCSVFICVAGIIWWPHVDILVRTVVGYIVVQARDLHLSEYFGL